VAGVAPAPVPPGATAAPQIEARTLQDFQRYAAATERRVQQQLQPTGPFLYIDYLPEGERAGILADLRSGEMYMDRLETRDASGKEIEVRDGMVHHWLGAVFIPGVTVEETLALVQDYNHHAEIYPSAVDAAHIIERDDGHFEVFMRFRKKKVITVVLETVHHVEYTRLSDTRAYSISRTTKVQEVDGDDVAKEPDTGRGFMWRINSYWRFDERDGGVYIECESISLTRDIPLLLRPLIGPFVNGVPEDTLTDTLEHVRDELVQAPSGDGGDSGPR
jgi:hypothetical protein